jgi:hypothetical protein
LRSDHFHRNTLLRGVGWLALVVMLACRRDSSGVLSGGIVVSSVTGTWSIILGDSFFCADSVPERVFEVGISGTEDDVLPAGSLNFTDSWSTVGGMAGTVYGTLNVLTGAVIMHLTRQDSLAYAIELRGFLDETLKLSGRATDPYPGYRPLQVTTRCVFDMRGSRTSP